MHFQPPYTGILYPRKEYGNLHHEDIHRCVCSEYNILELARFKSQNSASTNAFFNMSACPLSLYQRIYSAPWKALIVSGLFSRRGRLHTRALKYICGYWFVHSGAYNCPATRRPPLWVRAAKVQTFFHICKGEQKKVIVHCTIHL